jgi:hypothetical protein
MRQISRISALFLILPAITFFSVAPSNAITYAAPTNVAPSAVSGSSTSITVNFTNSSGSPAPSSYTVYVYSAADNYAVPVVTQSNYTKNSQITGLSPNTTYRARVQAIASSPHVSSGLSTPNTNSATTRPILATPATPTVDVVDGTVDSIKVSYSNVANATSYAIQVYLSSNNSPVGSLQSNFASGSNISNLNSNTSYVVKVIASASSGAYGPSTSDFSAAVRTNSLPEFPSVSADPQSTRVNPGQNVVFSISASAADSGVLSYQWQEAIGSGSFSNIPDATLTTLQLTNVTLEQNTNRYRVVVTNTLNGATRSTTSNDATLTVQISSDASLSSLSVTPGTISPRFSSSTSNYSISISATVTSLTVSASPLSDFSSMTLNDSALLRNEQRSVAVDTNSQSQVITIRVTAEDASTRDYVVAVKRVINNKTSTVVSPQVAPTKAATPTQPTKQIIQTPTVSALPRISALDGLSVSTGIVGTTVTINGTGFNSVLNVKLNGLRITPDSVTPTAITLTIPEGARSGTIVVTTNKGSASTPRFTVTN